MAMEALNLCKVIFSTNRKDSFSKRSLNDLKACASYLIKFSIEKYGTSEEIVKDCLAALKLYPIVEEGQEEPETAEGEEPLLPDHIPYKNATDRQIFEFATYLRESSPDYVEHIAKKAKTFIARVSMIYNIRDRICPTADTVIPEIVGAPMPAWWGSDEDRDLLRGVIKYGYQRYVSN